MVARTLPTSCICSSAAYPVVRVQRYPAQSFERSNLPYLQVQHLPAGLATCNVSGERLDRPPAAVPHELTAAVPHELTAARAEGAAACDRETCAKQGVAVAAAHSILCGIVCSHRVPRHAAAECIGAWFVEH
jgi:hypothetical protein